jgi:hypothetical protein
MVGPDQQGPELLPGTDAAVAGWMRRHGWNVARARWVADPDTGFHVWEEDEPVVGRSHALWIADSITGRLSPQELVGVLDAEGVAEEVRISYKIRVQERGAEYRVSPVPRRSGETRRQDLP